MTPTLIHAVEHALVVADDEYDATRTMYFGPDRAGNMLEIVVAVFSNGADTVIHAMPMRRKYEPLLRGMETNND
jgi:hypothetical protein